MCDLMEYCKEEAKRRGCTVDEIYLEEMEAQRELERITPKNEELLKIADKYPAPEDWYYEE